MELRGSYMQRAFQPFVPSPQPPHTDAKISPESHLCLADPVPALAGTETGCASEGETQA